MTYIQLFEDPLCNNNYFLFLFIFLLFIIIKRKIIHNRVTYRKDKEK